MSGGIVGIDDGYDTGFAGDAPGKFINIELPAPVAVQAKGFYLVAAVPGDAPGLLIGRRQGCYFITGLQQSPQSNKIGLGGSDGDQCILDTGSVIKRCDKFPQARDAVDMGVVNLGS